MQIAVLVIVAVSLAAASGCGSSAYGEKFQHRLEQLRISSEFAVLRRPTDDLAINFRIPQLFKKEFTAISADPERENTRILRQKFAPWFLPDFPGLERMFEGDFVVKDTTSPLFLYIGEGDPAAIKGKFPYQEWRDRLKRARFEPGAWEPVDVQTSTGGKLSWQRLTAKGKSAYDVVKSGKPDIPAVDTFFQMWVYETPQAVAVLGWWSTEEARVPSDIEKLASLTAGTAIVSSSVTVAPAPVAAGTVKKK